MKVYSVSTVNKHSSRFNTWHQLHILRFVHSLLPLIIRRICLEVCFLITFNLLVIAKAVSLYGEYNLDDSLT